MDVQTRGFRTFVTSEQSDIIQGHARPFESGTALMSKRVGRQCWQAYRLSNALNDFIEGSNSQWTAWITR